jgi:GNAT superfamily N-acetyltransferase
MAFASTLDREEAFSEDVWQERAARGAAGSDRVTFVAEQDGRWLGLATALLADPCDPDKPEVTLAGMFVDQAARQRGIGVALVESIIGWAQARGADRLLLRVTSGNEAAIALYRRCGFRPTGAMSSVAHTPSLTDLEMVRDLT